MLGQDRKQLGKKLNNIKKLLKNIKELFGTKFKDYLGATYDVFQNRSLIPLFTKPVSTEAVLKKLRHVFMKSATSSGNVLLLGKKL